MIKVKIKHAITHFFTEGTVMRKTKRIAAAALAALTAGGMISCGSAAGSSSADTTTTTTAAGKELNAEQAEQVASLEDQLEDYELKNKTIKWIAHYDINPYEGAVKDPAIELFEKKYGGKIQWVQSTWDSRFDDIATLVMSKNSPDFFPSSDMDTFPVGAVKGMFAPVDDIPNVDFDSDLWADTVDVMNQFKFNGKRYIAVIYLAPGYTCVYNRKTIEDYGFEDPAELYHEGKWDWKVFYDMCVEFNDTEGTRSGIDGYGYTNAICETCGIPIIGYENDQLVNNMDDPRIEKVQNFLYELGKQNVMFDRSTNNWYTRGDGTTGYGLGTYETLFIPVGLWALELPAEKTEPFGDVEAGEIMFCPMPKDPDGDKYYVSTRFEGYVMCRDAPNPEGLGAFLNCSMVCLDSTQNIKEETFLNEYKWTQEMVDMRREILDLCKTNYVFNISSGISSEMNAALQNVTQATMVTGGNSETWTECKEEYGNMINFYLKEMNEKLKTVAETGEFEQS